MTLTALKLFFKGLNWQSLAIKAGATLIVLMLTFGAGYYKGSQNTLQPFTTAVVQAVPKAQAAQQKQDKKVQGAAVAVSKAGNAAAKAGDAKAAEIVDAIHNTPSVVVLAGQCPVPTIEPDVLKMLNAAGLQ